MEAYSWVAIVTLISLLVYLSMGVAVGRARAKSGVAAPAMTGDPILERTLRVQLNTLEWLPIYLASLWLFALYWDAPVAAGLGVVWIAGRLLYAQAYVADPGKRGLGFMIQALACGILIFGTLGKLVWNLVTGGV